MKKLLNWVHSCPRICVLIILCLVISNLFVFQSALAQDKNTEEQVRQLFREVRNHLDKSEFKEAYQKCEQALRLNPDSSLLRFLRDELGEQYLSVMLRTPDLRSSAIRLMELAKGTIKPMLATEEQIKSFAAALDTESFTKKYEAINKLSAIGQRACPYLIANLGDEKHETIRANSLHALERMSYEAVLPLIEALNSKSRFIRQNTVIALGVIKDERAIPGLKKLLESTEELPEIKIYVTNALKEITAGAKEPLPSAKECYYRLAEKYYYSHPSVMINPYGTYFVWRWNKEEEKLSFRDVPEFVFNDELAEEACYQALRLDESYDAIIPLLICVCLSQYNKGELGLTSFQAQLARGEITQEILTKLQADLAPAKSGLFFGVGGTGKYLYRALEKSLTDKNVLVAVSCINALGECAKSDDLPLALTQKLSSRDKSRIEQENKQKIGQPLITALSDDDKRVRYAAAGLLSKIAPTTHFVGEEKVIPVIAEALGESGVRVVLIIEENGEVRAQLKKELVRLNCFPIETMTGKDGLERAKRFPSEDLIILNDKTANQVVFSVVTPLGTGVAETVFDSLRNDLRTKSVPIFILTDPENMDVNKAIFKENAKAYLTKPIDKVLLEGALNDAFSSEEAKKDSKSHAEVIAQRAAESLANLELANCVFPYLNAVDSLIAALEVNPDQVRIPVMNALGKFGDKKSVIPLTKVFRNTDNKKEIRIAACQALAGVFNHTQEPMAAEAYEMLIEGLKQGDFDIQFALAQVFGNAQLTPQQRREVFELMRLHPK